MSFSLAFAKEEQLHGQLLLRHCIREHTNTVARERMQLHGTARGTQEGFCWTRVWKIKRLRFH